MTQSSVQSILFFIALLKTVTGNEDVIYAQVGKEIIITAPADPNKNGYISWYYNDANFNIAWINPLGGRGYAANEPWSKQLSLSSDSLVIRNIQEANFGTYLYKLADGRFYMFKLRKLTVSGAPDSPLLPGDEISLNCEVETPQGENPPGIYWETPRGRKNSVDKIPVKSRDTGDWTCVVAYGKKTHRVKVSILVVDFPPASQVHYTSTTSQLNITFSIRPYESWEAIKPMIKEVEFFFTPKTALPENSQKLLSLSDTDLKTQKVDQKSKLRADSDSGGFSLSRHKGKDGDQGVYNCSVTFMNGKTLSSIVQVEVLQIIPKQGLTLINGQRLEMSCTIGKPLPPDMKAKWVNPEPSSPFIIDNSTNDLIVKEVSKEDGAKWRCELWRDTAMLTSAEIKMNIEPVLSVWMLLIICSAAAIIIILVVLTIILCRRKKRSGRHMRHRLCRCKNPKPKGFYRT